MNLPKSPIIAIPARLGASRLPDKPLADIHGEPMIVHVWRRAVAAELGPVVVACAEAAVAEVVRRAGGRAVLTRADHATGSDRVFEAVETLDPEGRHDVVVNLQGRLGVRVIAGQQKDTVKELHCEVWSSWQIVAEGRVTVVQD